MSGREVPFDGEARCDVCGRQGAFDFMGDFLCPNHSVGKTEVAADDRVKSAVLNGDAAWRPTEEDLARVRDAADNGLVLGPDNTLNLLNEIALLKAQAKTQYNRNRNLLYKKNRWRKKAEEGDYGYRAEVIKSQGEYIDELKAQRDRAETELTRLREVIGKYLGDGT